MMKRKTYLVGQIFNPPTIPKELVFETKSEALYWKKFYEHNEDPLLKGHYDVFSEDEYKLYCEVVDNINTTTFLALDVYNHTIERYRIVDFEENGHGVRFTFNKGKTTNSKFPGWNNFDKDFYCWFSLDSLKKIFKEGLYAETYLYFFELKNPYVGELSRICALTLDSLKKYTEREPKEEVELARAEYERKSKNHESLIACAYGYVEQDN